MADLQNALELHELGYRVVVGELGDPQTYSLLQVNKAALVVANSGDMINTNIAFTVREISETVPIVANADLEDSVDILELAGTTYVFQFMRQLGESLARRTLGASTRSNVIGSIESVLLAEAPAMRTPLEGKSLNQSRLREKIGVTVVGLWESGVFTLPAADTIIHSTSVLLLAGTPEQLDLYDEVFTSHQKSVAPVIILGGGRVGRAAGDTLQEQGIEYVIIEKNKNIVQSDDRYILGSAADINTLNRAGIREAPSIIITTHDDRTNIYLTIYCRRLRPDIQIICRANLDRSISKLHKAGADLVMSYTSIATSTIVNLLKPGELQMLAEGLNVFRITLPPELKNTTLIDSNMRQKTGCNLIAISSKGNININPDPLCTFEENDELILIGTDEAQQKFLRSFTNRI
jgi:Trk K+ transport system NAD-binding subunit